MGEHIPNFKTREEEARFWQKTSLEQLSPDQYQEAEIERPQRPLSATLAVRFDPETIDLLRRIARAQGLGATQLVREWVLERMRIERTVGVLADPSGAFLGEFEIVLRRRVIDELMRSIPAAAEAALQEVMERADLDAAGVRESLDG